MTEPKNKGENVTDESKAERLAHRQLVAQRVKELAAALDPEAEVKILARIMGEETDARAPK